MIMENQQQRFISLLDSKLIDPTDILKVFTYHLIFDELTADGWVWGATSYKLNYHIQEVFMLIIRIRVVKSL